MGIIPLFYQKVHRAKRKHFINAASRRLKKGPRSGQIDLKINDPSTNIDLTKNYFIIFAQYYLQQHIILLAVGVVLTALLPVYSKLLRKINTNVNVEGNGQMKAIDLTAE